MDENESSELGCEFFEELGHVLAHDLKSRDQVFEEGRVLFSFRRDLEIMVVNWVVVGGGGGAVVALLGLVDESGGAGVVDGDVVGG